MATKTVSKPVSIIYNFFKQFPIWCGRQPVTPSIQELEKYLSKNFEMHNNGQLILKSAAKYLDRLQKFQKKYADFQISQPLEEPIVSGNHAAIYYRLDLTTRKGEHKQIYVMGLLTVEDDKINRWVEVTNEKAASTWDT